MAPIFFRLSRRGLERTREHTSVCDRVSDELQRREAEKDQAKGVWGYMVK